MESEINSKDFNVDLQKIHLSLAEHLTNMDKRNSIDVYHNNNSKPLETLFSNLFLKENKKTKKNKVKDILSEFGQNTSVHGVKFVAGSNTELIKRLIWLMLILTCAGLLVWQIIDRVLHFYEWPVTVIVRINYNTTLEFPLVTICNQNAFKATIAARERQYKLLEKMYTQETKFNYSTLDEFHAHNISLLELYNETAHNKEDFIFRCSFKNKACHPDDFTRTVTDHGICYTFNNRHSNEHVSSPGVENGLRLVLNVEQYEYMPGPHDAAGVKMLLHGPEEIPRVHALGQAIPSGAHVVVGVKVVIVENLDPPYGKCNDKDLYYVDKYSVEACELDCLTRLAKKMCGCGDLYMPQRNGDPPVCTLSQYYLCFKDAKKTFESIKDEYCDCPVPCSYNLYEPDISYASTSQYAIDKLLTAGDKTNLKNSLIAAKEISSKYDDATFQNTVRIFNNFGESLNKIENRLLTNLSNHVDSLNNKLEVIFTKIESGYTLKEFLYRFQIYIVNKNFIRPRDAMEERVIHIIVTGYMEYIFAIENSIRILTDYNITDESARFVMYKSAMEKLTNRQNIVKMAYDNYTTLINAYDNAAPIFNYSFESLSRGLNAPATPKNLIKESRIHNSYARKYGGRYGLYLERTVVRIEWLMELVESAYKNKTVDEDRLFYCVQQFRWYMRNFLFARSVFYMETVEWPVIILSERLELLNLKWNEFLSISKSILQILKTLKLQINEINASYIQPLDEFQVAFHEYVHSDAFSKYNLSKLATSPSIQNVIVDFQTFFQHLRAKESDIFHYLSRMQTDMKSILEDIYEDEDAWDYYAYTGQNEYLRNFTGVMEEFNSTFKELKELTQFSDLLSNSDAKFMEAFGEVSLDFEAFLKAVEINSEFLRDNFLKLDIFYRQMSYEEIQQQKAYDVFALICDIGGSMGLFLGASILSICEVVDLLCSQFLIRTIDPKTLTKVKHLSTR